MSKNQSKINSSRTLEIFQSGQGADFVIEVMQQQTDGQDQANKEFNVHKYVLMANSDVFRAMFSHANTKESREGRILIEDSTLTAVHQMLIFLYTAELPEEYDIAKDAAPLIKIANKYQIESLMEFNAQKLVDSLSLANVFDRLEMADLYQIKSLYSACGNLIRRNLNTVRKSAKWIGLKSKLPQLAFSILEEFADDCLRCNCPPEEIKCYNCGLYGHFARECPGDVS